MYSSTTKLRLVVGLLASVTACGAFTSDAVDATGTGTGPMDSGAASAFADAGTEADALVPLGMPGPAADLATGQPTPTDIVTDGASVYWLNRSSGGQLGSIMKLAKSGGTPVVLTDKIPGALQHDCRRDPSLLHRQRRRRPVRLSPPVPTGKGGGDGRKEADQRQRHDQRLHDPRRRRVPHAANRRRQPDRLRRRERSCVGRCTRRSDSRDAGRDHAARGGRHVRLCDGRRRDREDRQGGRTVHRLRDHDRDREVDRPRSQHVQHLLVRRVGRTEPRDGFHGRNADGPGVDQPGPAAIAFDATTVYWTNVGTTPSNGSVRSVPKGGGAPRTISAGEVEPLGIAVDDSGVYWTNHGDGRIRVARK